MRDLEQTDISVDQGSGTLPSARPSATPEQRSRDMLVQALSAYMTATRNKADIRRAIAVWRNDVMNAGLEPQTLLVEFKKLLNQAVAAPAEPTNAHLVARREIILICIEEYYASVQDQ